MPNRIPALLLAALLLTAAVPARATVPGGDHDFQRAWRVFTLRQTDQAAVHFRAAADEYAEALAQDPMDRTMGFQSTLVKAGISFYYAGRYEECIATMKRAEGERDLIWEAALYTALSQAALDRKDEALKSLQRFRNALSSQRFITDAVQAQLPGMTDGSIALKDGMARIAEATVRQFADNVLKNSNRLGMVPAKEACGGSFWWRMNAFPCPRGSVRYY